MQDDDGGAGDRRTPPGHRPQAQRDETTAPESRVGREFDVREVVQGSRPGSKHVRLTWRYGRAFRRAGPGRLIATEELLQPKGGVRGRLTSLRRILLGAPLSTSRLSHERLSKLKALAVFSSDAISSSAYATEEILLALLLAGTAALTNAIPIAIAIACLLAVVVFSYRQTIRAYPNGGGSYIVARENLGTVPGLIAAAALMIDYVLTVAVSISAGVENILSGAQGLLDFQVEIALLFVILIVLGNLRGIRESGSIFAVPTYLFIFAFGAMIVVGIVKLAVGDFTGASLTQRAPPDQAVAAAQSLTLFLVLRAFASGSSALTGVEAISNGVPAFKPPESRNAANTLLWMGVVLGFFFLGVTFLADRLGIVPHADETVISIIAGRVFGESFMYYAVLATTAMILVLAANTSFADFPRLASILARDRFMPHQFTFRGERLAFSNGIIVLGVLAGILLVTFHATTSRLIPLYALGVFLSFTLSQSGMVVHWWRSRESGWRRSIVINGLGAVATAVVTLVVAATKFTHGAWVVALLIPLLVLGFRAIYQHYGHVEEQLNLDGAAEPVAVPSVAKVIVPVGSLNRAVIRTVGYARSLSADMTAIHIVTDDEEAEAFREQWDRYLPDTPIVVIDSPYRAFTEPLLAYLDAVDTHDPLRPLTVVIPEFVPKHWWQFFLHNQTSLRLKAALLFRPNTVVTDVPQRLLR